MSASSQPPDTDSRQQNEELTTANKGVQDGQIEHEYKKKQGSKSNAQEVDGFSNETRSEHDAPTSAKEGAHTIASDGQRGGSEDQSRSEQTHELVESVARDATEQGAPLETTSASSPSLTVAEDEIQKQTEQLSLDTATANARPESIADPISEKEGAPSPSPPPLPPKDHRPGGPEQVSAVGNSEQLAGSSIHEQKHSAEDSAIADSSRETKEVDDSRSEIQSIMEQFETADNVFGMPEIISPRVERKQPVLFPPRSTSLDPVQQMGGEPSSPAIKRTRSRESYSFSPSAARPPSIAGSSISGLQTTTSKSREGVASPSPSHTTSIFQPPPPSPEPEPDLPFDFHRFLEQLRHKSADPVARFLRSFLLEFGKKQWMVHEQVKIISDFLEFISKKMGQCEVWRTVSDAEFDNAREGMEKLVMNRLYSQTFSPAIPPTEATSPGKNKRTRPQTSPQRSARRGQHQEDVERDDVIAQKIKIYGWIREEHLDIAPLGEKGRKFLLLAQQEILKINTYRAPRDKVICVLNCCKVIFGFLKNNKGDQSADAFVPLLIYTVLRANPEHLVSNVQYIVRFRNQDKLGGEAGYYISSLMGVVSFIENLDRTNLTITDAEFERNVEASVSAITEGHKAESYEEKTHTSASQAQTAQPQVAPAQLHLAEKGSLSRPEVTPRNSMEGERLTPTRIASARLSEKDRSSTGTREESSTSSGDDNAAVGLLRSIQKPLSTIGRIFSDENTSRAGQAPASTPQPGRSPRLSPAPPLPERPGSREQAARRPEAQRGESRGGSRSRDGQGSAEDAAARQASAETAEAQRIRAQEHRVVVETLQGMFPDLDKDVISDVVRMKEGRVATAVDACLALSN